MKYYNKIDIFNNFLIYKVISYELPNTKYILLLFYFDYLMYVNILIFLNY